MIGILEHGCQVSSNKCEKQRGSNACWNQIQESWLGVFEEMHDGNRGQESGNVRDECHIEVEVRVAFQGLVVSEEKRDENPRNDNIAESKHGHVIGTKAIF